MDSSAFLRKHQNNGFGIDCHESAIFNKVADFRNDGDANRHYANLQSLKQNPKAFHNRVDSKKHNQKCRDFHNHTLKFCKR